jgi:hypothetical protein
MTPAEIEPATSRFVAQHLNHCATAVPFVYSESRKFTTIGRFEILKVVIIKLRPCSLVCIYVYTCVCMYVFMYVCMYICMHV